MTDYLSEQLPEAPVVAPIEPVKAPSEPIAPVSEAPVAPVLTATVGPEALAIIELVNEFAHSDAAKARILELVKAGISDAAAAEEFANEFANEFAKSVHHARYLAGRFVAVVEGLKSDAD